MGNELADRAAREAALNCAGGGRPPVSWAAARAAIARTLVDPAPSRPLVAAVYQGPIVPQDERHTEVMVARLRSGHSLHLASYRARRGLGESPTCPRCGEEDEDLEHWFRKCPATAVLRVGCFGRPDPPLATLSGGGGTVASYLRGLRLL